MTEITTPIPADREVNDPQHAGDHNAIYAWQREVKELAATGLLGVGPRRVESFPFVVPSGSGMSIQLQRSVSIGLIAHFTVHIMALTRALPEDGEILRVNRDSVLPDESLFSESVSWDFIIPAVVLGSGTMTPFRCKRPGDSIVMPAGLRLGGSVSASWSWVLRELPEK